MKTRRIPFDIKKAQSGAKVVTRDRRSVRILDYNLKGDTPIVAAVMMNTCEMVYTFKSNGKHNCKELFEYDLFIEEEIKYRPMTNQEFAWWLRACPEEHHEYKYTDGITVQCNFIYVNEDANKPIKDVLIRKNGGEWQEPLIEIE